MNINLFRERTITLAEYIQNDLDNLLSKQVRRILFSTIIGDNYV